MEPSKDNKKNHKLMKPWLFSLCSKLTTDAVIENDAPSLGQYLMAERRAASAYRRNQCASIYGPNDFSPFRESNSLFVGGQVAPSSSAMGKDGEREPNQTSEQSNGYGTPIVFSCLCG